MSEPINLHTADMLVALFLELQPGGEFRATPEDDTELHVPGFAEYLLVASAPIYGPGVGWSVRSMGPSDWTKGSFDVRERYSVSTVADFQAAVRHCRP